MNYDNTELPPRPGEKPVINGVPFAVYINGKPVEMSRKEALTVMAQIVNILLYLDEEQRVNETENR